jgi:hypothetical protein
MGAKCKDVITKTMMCVEGKLNTLMKMHVPDRRICYEVGQVESSLPIARKRLVSTLEPIK